jgi:hypothetical protein
MSENICDCKAHQLHRHAYCIYFSQWTYKLPWNTATLHGKVKKKVATEINWNKMISSLPIYDQNITYLLFRQGWRLCFRSRFVKRGGPALDSENFRLRIGIITAFHGRSITWTVFITSIIHARWPLIHSVSSFGHWCIYCLFGRGINMVSLCCMDLRSKSLFNWG